jgi:hypothetical protein
MIAAGHPPNWRALWGAGVAAAAALAASLPVRADDAQAPAIALNRPETAASRDSLSLFGGLMSTRSLGATLTFDFNKRPAYDNDIVGLVYDRDVITIFHLFKLGAEVGLADRFGHYIICCDTQVRSHGLVHSGELWSGVRLRYTGVVFFGTLRVAPSVTLGLSATTNSIGRERERELTQSGNAHLLFYFGPELAFSLRGHDRLELTFGVHHRSGANRALGHVEEGYDANTLGLRYRF